MLNEKTWEQETLDLLQKVEEEKRKCIQRVEAAKRAVEAVDERIRGIKITLNEYRQQYGSSSLDEVLNESLASEFAGMGTREMIEHRADTNGDVVTMRELSKDTAAAGLFSSAYQAKNTLYKTIARMENYEKIEPGIYRRREKIREVDEPFLGGHEPKYVTEH
jgi:hypothetical protein